MEAPPAPASPLLVAQLHLRALTGMEPHSGASSVIRDLMAKAVSNGYCWSFPNVCFISTIVCFLSFGNDGRDYLLSTVNLGLLDLLELE